jgi:predicted GIY-YIG superfamily endonuclease
MISMRRPYLYNKLKRTFLYRFFDEEHILLYVGVSFNYWQRVSSHKHTAKWIDRVSFITIERFKTREDAFEREKFIINNEKPLFNKKRNFNLKPKENAHAQSRN